MRGMGRIYKRGSIWWVEYWYRNRQHRESSGSAKESDAKRLLKQRLAEITIGKFVGPQAERVTMEQLFDMLEHDYSIRRGSLSRPLRSHLKQVREGFRHFRVIEITETQIDRYVKARLDQDKKPATVNYEMSLLRSALRLAYDRQLLARMPRVRQLPVRNIRTGYFEPDEIESIIENLPEWLRDVTRFAYLPGWRKGEISGLEWSDVHRQSKVIRLWPEITKTYEGRVLVLNGALWDIIERRWQEQDLAP